MTHGSDSEGTRFNPKAIEDQKFLAAILRNDLAAFIQKVFATVSPGDTYLHNWHIEAIAYELTRCRDQQINRLLITQPPRSLKSICTSVAFVAWAMGHNPKLRFICVSYSDVLAKDLSRQFRMVIESAWYRALFPKMRLKKDTDSESITTQGGARLATSIDGTLTGRGADVIIIDDPLKAEEARRDVSREKVNHWYSTTLISRLNDKQKGTMIMVMQRLHEDDLAGHVLERESWQHLDLPAIAVEDQKIAIGPGNYHHRNEGDILHAEHETLATLKRLEAQSGAMMFAAQYQQRPIPAAGNVIKRKWLQYYDQLPELSHPRIIQSWDPATSISENASYSVCTTWLVDRNSYYLVNVWRDRLNFPDVKRMVKSLARTHNADVILIEKAGPGLPLLQELLRDNSSGIPRPIGIVPDTDKQTRMEAQSTRLESHQVYLPKTAPWLREYLNELLGFPNTKHDDQVDSTSQFLRWITQDQNTGTISLIAPVLVRL